MSVIIPGKVLESLFATAIIALILFFYNRGRNGIGSVISKIPALDAIENVVNRAAEMGKTVHVSPGRGTFDKGNGPEILAGLEVAVYAAKIAARAGAPLIFTCGDPAMVALAEERLKTVYSVEGHEADYSKVSIEYYSGTALNLAILQILEEKNIGASIWVGYFGNEAVYLGEQGASVGAMQVAGTTSPVTVAFIIPSCDYTLICEEVFAAGAYLSGDPVSTSDIASRDYMKLIALALIFTLTLLLNLGINFSWLFKL